MLYMPATTLSTPVVLQEALPTTAARYYMIQPSTMVPTLPLLSTPFLYPGYGFMTKSVETVDTGKSEIKEVTQPVQHVIHHYAQQPCSVKTCPGYCELCCPWIEHSNHRQSRSCSRSRSRSRSRSPPPPIHDQQRHSRRDEFDRSNHGNKHETIDEKIERLRRELNTSSISKHDRSTETIDYYHRPRTPPVEQRIPYKQHYDAPRPRSLSRPRSTSSHRASSLPRNPWRPSNQNDYPWRDSHLPAYREATLSRTQTPVNESRTWKETAHQQSHLNTQKPTSYYSKKEYVYRPKSETEARKWYTQSTGKNADHEVYQSLHGNTSTHKYTGSSTHYDRQQYTDCNHSFYSDIPITTKSHTLKKIDSTQYHNLYGCNEPCLHIVPKQGSTLDPPYLKILNAPVTYLH